MIEIKELFHIEKGSLQSSKCIPGEYDFITASSTWKTHNSYTHDQEALLIAVAASGSLGRTHYVNGRFIGSDLCFILTPKSKHPVNLKFYQFILNSVKEDLVYRTATGSAKKAINKTNFGAYKLPYIEIEQQDFLCEKLFKAENILGSITEECNNLEDLLNLAERKIILDGIHGVLSQDWRNSRDATTNSSDLLEAIKEEKEELLARKAIRKEKPVNCLPYPKELELPGNWAFATVEEISFCLDFMRKPVSKDKRKQSPGDIPYYGANGQVDTVADFIFDEPLILVLEDETFIGRTKPFSYLIEGKSWVNNHAHVLKPGQGIMPEYLNLLLYYYDFIPLTSGTTNRQKLTKSTLLGVQLPIAPSEEQEVIVQRVTSLLQVCNETKRQLNSFVVGGQSIVQSFLNESLSQE